MRYYCVGILQGAIMANCHITTTDYTEAKTEAQKTNKNVYEFVKGKYFLRKIFYNPLRNLI